MYRIGQRIQYRSGNIRYILGYDPRTELYLVLFLSVYEPGYNGSYFQRKSTMHEWHATVLQVDG